MCADNLVTFFSLAKRFQATPKIEVLQEGLLILIELFSDDDSEIVHDCINVLFANDCDGLKVVPMISPDSPLLILMRRQATASENGLKLLKLFMNNSSIGPHSCTNIYNGSSPFSKHYSIMEDLLLEGEDDSFKRKLDDFGKNCKLATENAIKVEQYNKFIVDYDKAAGSSNKNKLTEIRKNNYIVDCEKFLQIATEKASTDVAEFLLNKVCGLKIKNSIKIACIRGHHEILELLLKKCETIESVQNRNLLHEICQKTHRRKEGNIKVSHQKCFQLMITKFPQLIHERNDERNTPLHIATMTSRRNKDEIVKLLLEGSELTLRNNAGFMPIDGISKKAFEDFLNECVAVRNDDDEVEIDYRFLLPRLDQKLRSPKETFLLHKIVERPELRPLVVHAVITGFVHLKWWKLRFWTVANFALMALFMISMTTFVFSSRYEEQRLVNLISRVTFAVSLAVMTIRELLQLLMSGLKYFKHFTNWLEMLLIVCSVYCIVEGFHKYATIPLFMITGYELYTLFGTLPFWCLSTYRAILEKVMSTFLKSFFVFLIIPLSFALCFNTLYFYSKQEESNGISSNSSIDGYNTFQYPFMSVIKVFAMMIGEFGE